MKYFKSARSIFPALHICICAGILWSCSAKNQYAQQDKKEHDTLAVTELDAGTEGQNTWQKNNCPRGIPTPTLSMQNPNIVNKNFTLLANAGIEKAKMYSGDSLIVENGGCEFYVLTYTLKSTNITAENNASFWFEKGSDLLLALQDSDVAFDFRTVSAQLKKLSANKNIKAKTEYDLAGAGQIQQKVVLEEFGKTADGKGTYMKLKFFIGPL